MCFTTIQLLEAGIWYSLKENSKFINELLTRLIVITLYLQPFIQTRFGFLYTGSGLLEMLSYVFFAIIIYGFYRIVKGCNFSASPGTEGHLVWKDETSVNNFFAGTSSPISYVIVGGYFIGLFLPLLYMKQYRGLALMLVGMATALYSMSHTTTKEFSSYWCFSSVAYSITALFV
jgi:hypothetical protein